MTKATFVESLQVSNTLGENILWCSKTSSVWWIDIQEKKLLRYHLPSKKLSTWETPERIGSFGFTNNESLFITAFESGFATYNPNEGKVDWLAKPEEHLSGNRLNDGRVDRQGRFWSGAMVETENPEGILAGLYRLDRGTAQQMETNIKIANGLCWSLDSKTMYFADSPRRTLYAYDFDAQSGDISNKRIFAETPEGISPDGSIIDAEGYLWNAQWGGSQVVRYAPNGEIDFTLKLPVSQPTCLAFGGEDLSTLFITSARKWLSDEQLDEQVDAGGVLVYQTEFTGVAEARYRL